MLAPALAICLWLIDRAQDDIAQLTYITAKKPFIKPFSRASTGRYAVLIIVMFMFNAGNIIISSLLTSSCLQLLWIIYHQQDNFAVLDRASKSKYTKATQYIDGTKLKTHSGWANDPLFLRKIPSYITSRKLTCATILEITLMLSSAFFFPRYGAITLAFCILGHYITDALDGAVGRFRKEGHILWGYYTDHCLDALYECAAILTICLLANENGYLAGFLLCVMTSIIYGFHLREFTTHEQKLATHYTNLIGPFPLHYGEWAAIVLGVAVQLFSIPWLWVIYLLCPILSMASCEIWYWNAKHIEFPKD